MRTSFILLAGSAALVGCGRSSDQTAANNDAANAAATTAKPAAYCFFKDAETKGWTAKAGKDGNVIVSGKAYRQDARYKALLPPAVVSGTSATVSPTIVQNDTGFAAPDNWWDVSETIPNSQAVTSVTITCGDKTLATIAVPRPE